jgi:hypothetical protein
MTSVFVGSQVSSQQEIKTFCLWCGATLHVPPGLQYVFNKDEMDGTRPKACVCFSDACETFGRLDQVHVTSVNRNEETGTSSVSSTFMSSKASHTKLHSAGFFLQR